ncbi:Retrovirus-related Pol polyprotein like [Argiope bruennichi]|uniref:Retrovirus-related Pol polyprotein like n=1 Tax=Argiope bruennichi TaxID=94029 RepID=A0A8T0FK47_ARGBR|nr:Retrovirus-related Pol polyprotein like [Argiope bruennichi]
MDEKDLKSALAYSMKYEAAKTASRSPRHVGPIEIKNGTVGKSDDKFESLCNMLEKLLNSRDGEKNIHRRNPNVTCWRCNKKGHLQTECSPEAIPIPDQEASTVAGELVRSWISCYGVPVNLHSDQGTNFNSALFTELCKLLEIEKTRTTALHPESDGMVERFNPTILNNLSLFVSKNQTDWDVHLPLFLLGYRSTEHEATRLTPAEMLFGRTLRLPCDILFGRPNETPSSPNEYMKNLEARLESIHTFCQ